MSVNEGRAILEFEVILKARVDDSEVRTKTPKAGKEQGLAQDLLDYEKDEPSILRKKALKDFEKFASELDTKGLKNLKALTANPGALVQNKLLSMLGRAGVHGAIAVAIITLVIESPEIVKAVVEALGVKGGPLNQDYTRRLDEDFQTGITKDLQFRRAIGLDVIITNEDTKYILTDPGFVNNSLVDIETTRSIRINSNQTQYGYVNGL